MMLRILFLSLMLSVVAASASEVVTTAPDELAFRLSTQPTGLLVLDVRTAEEFAAGHVPGAINISHDVLDSRISELESARDTDIVVYCRSGKRAGLAISMLEKAGFTRLVHLEGDYIRWSEEGRPVESTPAE